MENEIRGDLAPSDKSYWTEKIFKRYNGDGYTANEAIELAAKYLGLSIERIHVYYGLAVLPEEVMDMVDRQIMTVDIARANCKEYL